jgi:predicted RNA-binding Zn-ribbon protein involved in translation (DUF1610 family)
MPWTASDAEEHTKKADTEAKQKKWAKVANSALESCIEDGGKQDECEGRAIRIANAAMDEEKERQTYTCECLDCGHVMESEEHCVDIECPECGGEMRRKERPGKGRAMNKILELLDQLGQAIKRELGIEHEEPPERAIGTMRLHEQFYTLLRDENDEWPRVLDIYLDDGGMYGLVASQGRLYRYPLAVEEDDLQITGDRQQVMEIHQPTAEERAVTVHRQADGRARWTTVACTAILNRVGEIDSTALFDNMIRRAEEESGEYPYLTLWHLGEPFKMGQADMLARDGVVYIASGLFDEDNELAEAVARDVEEEPAFWGDSIKYKPIGEPEMVEIAEGVHIPVYRDGEHIEISLLPEKRAASWFTALGVSRQEVERMKAEVEGLLRKVLGDKADDWIGRVDDINRAADEEGMVTRDEEGTAESAAPPAEGESEGDDVERTVELDDEAMEAILRAMTESDGFAEIVRPLFEAVERLGGQVDALTKKLDEVGIASTEGLVQVRERLDDLERDEEEKQREWLADLPQNRTTRVTYRPREVNDPDKGNGQSQRPSYADVAESTLSNMPTYGSRR